jgi:enoyl-CoA hydratase/carnithine racemase
MYTGEPIEATTAHAWGLVNRVVPPGEALAAAVGLARVLAQRPSRALQLMKQAVALGLATTEGDAIARTLALSDAVFRTEDCREGVRAFFAKETPRFGR